jgi:hypothetical protein
MKMGEIISQDVSGRLKRSLGHYTDLTSITTQLATKANQTDVRLKTEKLNQTDLSDTLLQQIAGTTPINAVPADGSITAQKTVFFDIIVGKNLYDATTRTDGYILNSDGTLTANASYAVSDYIPVTVGKTVYSSQNGAVLNMAMLVAFDINKTKIGNTVAWDTSYTIPSNCAYIRFCSGSGSMTPSNHIQIEYDVVSSYVPYSKNTSLKTSLIGAKTIDNTKITPDLSLKINQPSYTSLGKNLFNANTAIVGYKLDTSGNLVADATFTTSDFIPAKPGKTVYFSLITGVFNPFYVCAYDANFNFVGVSAAWVASYTIPSGASYMRYCGGTGSMTSTNQQQAQYDAVTPYEPYQAFINMVSKPVYDIILPKKIPVVVGHTLNIYHETILSKAYLKEVMVQTQGAGYLNFDNLSYTPQTGDTNKTITATVTEKGKQTLMKQSTIIPVAVNAGTGTTKKVLVIGDSKTDNPTKLQELINLFSGDAMAIDLIGTRGVAPYESEGRSSWGIRHYYNQQTFNGGTNPFYNSATGFFDFSYYMSQKGYTGVDIVIIDLGANDNNYAWSELQRDYDYLINSIHAYDANIKICLSLQEGHSMMQMNTSTFQQSKLQHDLNLNLINYYDGRESEKIYLLPQHMNVDPLNDYQTTMAVISNRNPTQIAKCTDIVHPSNYGYYKIADMYYYMIKYLASLG